jgi:hypothetical protein
MKHIKPYKIFERFNSTIYWVIDNDYDIYDFLEDLKDYSYNDKDFDSRKGGISRIKGLSDIFIGEGIFERVVELVDSIFNSIGDVDIRDVRDGMVDVFDEYHEMKNRVQVCIFGSELINTKKFNTIYTINSKKLQNEKTRIISSILRDMVYPTLYIGHHPQVKLRNDDLESHLVMFNPISSNTEIFQCKNFDINNFAISKVTRNISLYELDKKRIYDIEKFFDMYKPGIYITLDGNYEYTLNVKKIESELDIVLPAALHGVDYEEIIYGARFGARSTIDGVGEYSVKILLK